MTNLMTHIAQVVDYLLNRQPAEIEVENLVPGTFMLLPQNLYGVYLRQCGQYRHFFRFHPTTGCMGVHGYAVEEIQEPEEGEMFTVLNQMSAPALDQIQRVAVTHIAY